MEELNSVLSSDLPTRNGDRFTAKSLCLSLLARWDTGVPSLLSHDAHEPIGWMIPRALSFQPGMTRLHGTCLIPNTQDEQAILGHRYQHYVNERINATIREEINHLNALIKPHVTGQETEVDCSAACLVSDGLARRCAPAKFAKEDGDGLILLADLKQLLPGVFKYGELLLFAHPTFRKRHSRWNNFNSSQLDSLNKASHSGNLVVRIRLDPDMVGLATSIKTPIEHEYWHGPKFNNDLSKIDTGITRHESTKQQLLFSGVSRTEFWWQSRKGQHIFEAEEIRDTRTFASHNSIYGCRYIHSIVNEADGKIEHLDGAVRCYTEEGMILRLDQNIAQAGRNTDYIKYWRVDGSIDLVTWKSLIHHAFQGNEHISEYFGMEKEKVTLWPEISELDEKRRDSNPVTRVAPYSRKSGSSARSILSIHHVEQSQHAPRSFIPDEYLSNELHKVDIIDITVLEIRKILRRSGDEIYIPDNISYLACEDHCHHLPVIRHMENTLVHSSIDAILAMLSTWKESREERTVSFSLSCIHCGREVMLSFLGESIDILPYLEFSRSLWNDLSDDGISSWVEGHAAMMRANCSSSWPPKDDDIDYWIDEAMTGSFTYRPRRVMIDQEKIKFHKNKEAFYSIGFSENEADMAEAMMKKVIHPAIAYIVTASKCTKCSLDYMKCPCSKILDQDVGQVCTNFRIAYFFWTDRPA